MPKPRNSFVSSLDPNLLMRNQGFKPSSKKFDENVNSLITNITDIESNLKTKLRELIIYMPEYMAVQDYEDATHAASTTMPPGPIPARPASIDVNSIAEFWNKLMSEDTRNSGATEPSLKDLTDYIEKNYTTALYEQAKTISGDIVTLRTRTLQECATSARQLLDNQLALINENSGIIELENARLASLLAKHAELSKSRKHIDLQIRQETDPDKITELENKLEHLDLDIDIIKESMNKLQTGRNSIGTMTKQNDALQKNYDNQKNALVALFSQNGFPLYPTRSQTAAPAVERTNPAAPAAPAAGTALPAIKKSRWKWINKRREKKAEKQLGAKIFQSYQNSPDKKQFIDGKGFGDLYVMSKYLGRKPRKEFKTVLQNRIKEYNKGLTRYDPTSRHSYSFAS